MEILIEDLDNVNDLIIDKIVRNESSFEAVFYEKALEVHRLRNLGSPEKQKFIQDFPKILEAAKKHAYKSSSNLESISALLRKKGVSENQIPLLAEQLLKTSSEKETKRMEFKNFWIFILILVFWLFRMIVKNLN